VVDVTRQQQLRARSDWNISSIEDMRGGS